MIWNHLQAAVRWYLEYRSRLIAMIVLCGLAVDPAAGADNRPKFDFGFSTSRESNIYHSAEDSDRVASVLNVIDADVDYDRRLSSKLLLSTRGYLSFDWYPNYSQRNKGNVGVRISPTYTYSRRASVTAQADVSRRDKDLIDDSGQLLARTLKRWNYELGITHNYDIGRFSTELDFMYENINYDEVDSTVTVGDVVYDVPMMSYDYHGNRWRLKTTYDVTSRVKARIEVGTEKRYYDERRTYTVTYGAVKGRPFEIRNYRENAIEMRVYYRPFRQLHSYVETSFTRRKDNFQNFYGYDQWQHRVGLTFRWNHEHRTDLSFRAKTKRYDNYFTSRIPDGDRVSIDYFDFQLEQQLELTPSVALIASLRNYNKVSNDPHFDYHDVTLGLGARLSY